MPFLTVAILAVSLAKSHDTVAINLHQVNVLPADPIVFGRGRYQTNVVIIDDDLTKERSKFLLQMPDQAGATVDIDHKCHAVGERTLMRPIFHLVAPEGFEPPSAGSKPAVVTTGLWDITLPFFRRFTFRSLPSQWLQIGLPPR